MNENNIFQYTYSATRNQEIESICKKYLPPEENKLELLRRLDHAVNNAGTILALVIGILGSFAFGSAMCFFMHIIGGSVLPGIPLGLLGIAAMLAAYPICRIVRRRKKAELTPRILELTEELMNG